MTIFNPVTIIEAPAATEFPNPMLKAQKSEMIHGRT
jgi:hypothetical protein